MREILFRGFSENITKNEWIYGDLVQYSEDEFYILESNNRSWDILHDGILIEKESIGQFTGLLDKNGNKIFEGDKVKFHYFYQGFISGGAIEFEKEIEGIIEIRTLGLFIKCDNEDAGGYLLFYQPHEESFEIIRNIHENK